MQRQKKHLHHEQAIHDRNIEHTSMPDSGQTIIAYHSFCIIHQASGLIYLQFRDDKGKLSNKLKSNCQHHCIVI